MNKGTRCVLNTERRTCPLVQSLCFLHLSRVSRLRRLSEICSATRSVVSNRLLRNLVRGRQSIWEYRLRHIWNSSTPLATVFRYFLSEGRELDKRFLPPNDLLQKDRSKSFFYSLTLHCDLLSGSREPLARPAGEGPRTIRTWSRFIRNDWTTRLFDRARSCLCTLSFLMMHRNNISIQTISEIIDSSLILVSFSPSDKYCLILTRVSP